MEYPYATNKQLARDYLSVVTQYAPPSAFASYFAIRDKIELFSLDLSALFLKEGNLRTVQKNYRVFGHATLKILELILEEGFEEARRIVAAEKERRLARRNLRIHHVSARREEGVPPSWDNAVRRLEG